MSRARLFLGRYWFLLLLLLVLPIGTLLPEGGEPIRASEWVIRSLVATTLCITGFLLDTGRLVHQATNLKAIVLTLGSTYVVAPAAAFALARLWGPAADEGGVFFTQGMLIMAAQAGTLASALALTIVARGNQELALVLTLLSNSLTVVLTPLVLAVAIGAQVEIPVAAMIYKMVLVVLLPVAVGQLLRRFFWQRARPILRGLRIVPQLIILVFVYAGFSAAAPHLESEPALALRYLGACASLHVFLLAWNHGTSKAARLDAGSRTAVVYCGSQKTLPNGMYLWATFFAANPYGAVPLALYHLFQLVVDTLILPVFERMNRKE